MNLYDSILASRPLTAFKMNAAGTTITDMTNRGVALTSDPTLAFESNIIPNGSVASLSIKNANRGFFTSGPVYKTGLERQSFTMEAWFLPADLSSGTISIMSRSSAYDGLSADIDKIHFKINWNTLTDTDVYWSIPDFYESYHVVGVYTPSKAQLYINGELVSEQEISEAQVADGFATSSGNLYVGQSSGNMKGVVDGLAIYTRALNDAEIYRHYLAGRKVLPATQIAGIFGGNVFDGTNRDVLVSREWSSREDWPLGQYTDVEFEAGDLRPTEDPTNQESLAGTWIGVFETGMATSNLYGVQVDWDGDGSFTVEASINSGSSWVAVTNGRPITGTYNWNATDIDVLIRVTFAGGIESDISSVRRIRAIAFTSPTVYGTDRSRVLSLTAAVATLPYPNEPIERNIKAGLESFGSSGLFSVMPDVEVEDARNVASLEFWIKFNVTQTSKYVFDSRPAGGTEFLWSNASNQFAFVSGTLTVNGVQRTSGTFAVEAEKWYHIVYTFATPTNVRIDIPSPGDRQVALLNTYADPLTVANAAMMYKLYGGYPVASLATDSNSVSEPATAYKLYAYDWSISPTG